MSVLLQDEDAAALEEALAFIDEFSLSPADWTHLAPIDAPSCAASAPDGPPKKKRVRDPNTEARRRLKRKGEREALRLLVKQLERQLAKARRTFQPRSESSDATDGDESDKTDKSVAVTKRTALRWYRALMEEQRRRRVSEELNAQLRSAVSMQSNVVAALQQCLKLHKASTRLNVRSSAGLPAPTPLFDAGCLDKVLGEMSATVRRLYEEASASWDPSLASSVTCNYSIKTDPEIGRYCETRSSTPLGQSLASVSELIRIGFLWNKFPMTSASLQAGKVTTMTKQIAMDLEADGSSVRLYAAFVLHWHYEADRVVVAFSSLMFHPSGKFCFREGGWLVLQQSPDHPSKCSYQNRTRLASQMLVNPTDQDDESLREYSVGMEALSKKVKTKCEQIQHRLLVESGRADCARMLPTPHDSEAHAWASTTIERSISVDDAPTARCG